MISDEEWEAFRQDFRLFADSWPHLNLDLTVRENGAEVGEPVLHLTAGRHSEEEDA